MASSPRGGVLSPLRIILSLAVEGNFGRLVGTDTSVDALAVAQRNKIRICPEKPVDISLVDFLQNLRQRPVIDYTYGLTRLAR